MNKRIYVTKMNGKREFYSEQKLERSLKSAGADKETIKDIVVKVGEILHDGIETKRLFRFAFKELKKKGGGFSSRYNLKNAIIELRLEGGYIFEKFIAKVLQHKEYDTELNLTVKGKNITHEIDILGRKGKEVLMVECKHHSKPWIGCHIQNALYVYARFLDVRKKFNVPMLVTNTKFSSQIIRYGKGVGLRLMGWKYPKGDSLEENIEKFKIYPVTVLNLPKSVISKCLENGILTVEEFRNMKLKKVVKKLNINEKTVKKIVKDCSSLYK